MKDIDIKNLIFYEIYPTSFYDSNNDGIGDLNGIIKKLDYVKNLGCNAIWLNPFYKSPFLDGGYDVSDFFDVDPRFGSLDDLKRLIQKADDLDIYIFVDLVAGHASEENPIFLKSAEAERNEYSDLFIWTNSVWDYDSSHRFIAGRHPRNGAFMVNFFAHQPAFNFGFNYIANSSYQMYYLDERTFLARHYILNIMRFYLSLGVKGFRVDMADSLVKNDPDKNATIEVWRYIFNIIKKEYPNSIFVSEWSNPHQAFAAGFDIDFVLDHYDNFYHRLARSIDSTRGKCVLKGGDISFFIKDLNERIFEAREANKYLGLISGNHDTWRIANYLDEKELRLFYLILFSLPGVPFIYYGDEIMMKTADLSSKDGGYQRTGSRTPMQWNKSKNAGFSSYSSLYLPTNLLNENNVEEFIDNKDSMYHFIKKLIDIRKCDEDLTSNEYDLIERNKLIVIRRRNKSLYINLSDEDIFLDKEIIISTGKDNILRKFEGAICK